MWDVVLSVLSIFGGILLVLLIFAAVFLLLVLFYPITYRVRGQKTVEEKWILAKIKWLFGLLQIKYSYPEPGNVTVRLFGRKVFDTNEKRTKKKQQESNTDKSTAKSEEKTKEQSFEQQTELSSSDSERKNKTKEVSEPNKVSGENIQNDNSEVHTKEQESSNTEKIDKIRKYTQILKEKETVELWKHVKLRLLKILKSIRPRHIRADIIFGTGSPDTTGYVFGIYGMLSPYLGKKVNVTPDFTRAVFQGDADISGHITVFVLMINGLKLLLDKRLHLFLKKCKKIDNVTKQKE